MCGIVGLLLKDPALRPRLGELMVPMMIGMTERGPDSAGLAVFTEPVNRYLDSAARSLHQPDAYVRAVLSHETRRERKETEAP